MKALKVLITFVLLKNWTTVGIPHRFSNIACLHTVPLKVSQHTVIMFLYKNQRVWNNGTTEVILVFQQISWIMPRGTMQTDCPGISLFKFFCRLF